MDFIVKLNLLRKFFFSTKPAKGPEREVNLGHIIPEVNLQEYYKSLEKFDFVKSDKILELEYQGKIFEVNKYAVNSGSKNKILILTGVHGNETAPLFSILNILKKIEENPNKYKNFHFEIISPVNPVGVSYKSRYNKDGIDINRDFKLFITSEARLLKKLCVEFRPHLVLSFHEGPQKDFFMWVSNFKNNNFLLKVVDYLHEANIKIASKTYLGTNSAKGFVNTDDKLWHVLIRLMNIKSLKTMGDYLREKNIASITSESSWIENNIEIRAKAHSELFEAVIDNWSLLSID